MNNLKKLSQDQFRHGNREYTIYRLSLLEAEGLGALSSLPYCIRILLENLLRNLDGETIVQSDIEQLMTRYNKNHYNDQLPWFPGRVIMQDFSALPVLLDLAVMRETLNQDIQLAVPVDVIIDHSLSIIYSGYEDALKQNMWEEFHKNHERFAFLKWAGQVFPSLRLFPPGSGIIHQVNLEYLATLISTREQTNGISFTNQRFGQGLSFTNQKFLQGPGAVLSRRAPGRRRPFSPMRELFPETLIGTDSHTTMINGMGVLGWGVGGIEAGAVILGQPNYIKIPAVVGVYLTGQLGSKVMAMDLALAITQFLRNEVVVENFVEFIGPGVQFLSIPDRATVANMAPEYGATLGYFPVDDHVINYLNQTGRKKYASLVQCYYQEQSLYIHGFPPREEVPCYSRLLTFDLDSVEPSVSGPSKPWQRIPLTRLPIQPVNLGPGNQTKSLDWHSRQLAHGSIVLAAITSCTNTSNPLSMIAAGLVARNSLARGLTLPSFIKTSFIPGSRAVVRYLEKAGLMQSLQQLGFYIDGYGCGVCVGNSGNLKPGIEEQICQRHLHVVAVLSGNRNFEARIHPRVQSNFLASPPMVVVFALAGTINIDIEVQPLGLGKDGLPVFMRDIWPDETELQQFGQGVLNPRDVVQAYAGIFQGGVDWQSLPVAETFNYPWDSSSTYVRKSPFFESIINPASPGIMNARVLLVLGDAVTTDHISPVSAIPLDSPAAAYLYESQVKPDHLNSYGARRGNHEVMVRGAFTHIRLRNWLVEPREGGWTRKFPSGEVLPVYQAVEAYRQEGIPLLVFAGENYGTGSARDWAAKATMMMGIRAVIAVSFERIHRSNLIGMGVLPLQFEKGVRFESLGLQGDEIFSIQGLETLSPSCQLMVKVKTHEGLNRQFPVLVRLDTPKEVEYYQSGGILPYCLKHVRL